MNMRHALSIGLSLTLALAGIAKDAAGGAESIELRSKSGGRVWVYLPKDAPPDAKVACVLVPPAGSRLFHGMTLGEGDRDEHVPYVSAGFAVVAFDISGAWPATESNTAIQKSIKEFASSRCGVSDALNALQAALEKYPQIDAKRVFVAGHSSAGTLALQVAAASPQFKGCIAYAPITDLDARLGTSTIRTLDRASPGIANMLHDLSPIRQVDALQCPVFIFHADDDANVTTASIISFRNALVARQKTTEFVSVKSGGHYDSMIKQGIPKAIAWMTSLDAKAR